MSKLTAKEKKWLTNEVHELHHKMDFCFAVKKAGADLNASLLFPDQVHATSV